MPSFRTNLIEKNTMHLTQETTNLVQAVEVWGKSESGHENTLRVQSGIYGKLNELCFVVNRN